MIIMMMMRVTVTRALAAVTVTVTVTGPVTVTDLRHHDPMITRNSSSGPASSSNCLGVTSPSAGGVTVAARVTTVLAQCRVTSHEFPGGLLVLRQPTQ